MKKTISRIFAILIATVMMVCLCSSAFAAEESGSITISAAAVGETYKIYKVFELTYVNTGVYTAADYDAESGAVYYTLNGTDYEVCDDPANSTETLYVQSRNVAYTFTKTSENEALFDKLMSDDSPFGLVLSAGVADTYIVSLKSGKEATDIISFFKDNIELLGDATAEETAEAPTSEPDAEKADLTFTDLELGYYYITSTLGTVVTINSTTPDVTVVDKNDEPAILKQVKEDSTGIYGGSNTAGITDTVEFLSTITIPGGVTQLTMHDTSVNLSIVSQSVVIYTDSNLSVALEPENYAAKYDTTSLEIEFSSNYLERLENVELTTLYVTYSATVDADAVINSKTENNNTAYLTYGNAQESTHSETFTVIYDFDLHKYADDDTEGYLADAEFILSYTDNKGTVYATFESEGNVYTLSGWISDKAGATHIITTDDGAITIEGLDADTYELIEVAAPKGYNLLAEPVKVMISEEGQTTIADPNDSSKTISVEELTIQNQSGSLLPSTGGIGTTIFYVVGSLLIAFAGILLIVKIRMRSSEEPDEKGKR